MDRVDAAVLISGRGSNLQALIDAARMPSFPLRIALVVSNRPDAQGLRRADEAGIAGRVIDDRAYADRPAFEEAVTAALRSAGVRLVCLAGFMKVVSPAFVDTWHDRLINIHPSLLPAFPGLDTHERAIAAGVKLHGCSVHFVRAKVDDGPIIGQAAVPVLPGDTAETLAARVLAAEHRLYPWCARLVAECRVSVVGQVARVDGGDPPHAVLINPAPLAGDGQTEYSNAASTASQRAPQSGDPGT